jgi:hypothetical protein
MPDDKPANENRENPAQTERPASESKPSEDAENPLICRGTD